MFRDLVDFFLAVVLPVGILLCVLGVPAVGGVYLLEREQCSAKSAELGLSHRFGFFQGCFVSVDGESLPLETYLQRKVEQNVAVRVK